MYEGASHAQLAELAQRLAGALAALYGEMDLPSPDVGHVGGATYREQAAGELMSAVDMALRQAQQQGANAWRILETAMSGEVATTSEWQGLLEQALDEGLFRLQQQPVFVCRSRGLMHRELFLRLPDPRQEGEVIPAGVLMPMAESLRMSTWIDRWVI